MILIIGSLGNMGRRYGSILSSLNKAWIGVDRLHSDLELHSYAKQAHGILIATPTDTHEFFLDYCLQFKKPVLCEKPLIKDDVKTKSIVQAYQAEKVPLRMVMQYENLHSKKYFAGAHTFYDYYNHGKDGIYWDCIQLISLAKGEVYLHEESPVWTCYINGWKHEIQNMDKAYIAEIKRWFKTPRQDYSRLIDYHKKTQEMHDNGKSKSCLHRHSSTFNQRAF